MQSAKSLKISPAGPGHVKDIVSIAHQSWEPTYKDILTKEQLQYMLDTIYAAETLAKQILTAEQQYIIAHEGSWAVGFASYAIKNEDPSIVKLHKLYCHTDAHGKGYGKALIQTVIDFAKQSKMSALELNVNRDNKTIGFYKYMGFNIVREEDIPIGPYFMNDYVMRKDI